MRSIFPRFIIACALALPLSAPVTAQAGPPGKSDVATDKARELHVEADSLYKQGQYARARVSYIAAWALKKHWQIAGSLGDTEVKLGMFRDAAEHLAYYMRASPNQPPSQEAQKLFREARSKIGTLNVTVDVAGAEVVVDGKLVGKTPLEDPVFVEPGHHTIEARLGAKLTTIESAVAAGDEKAIPLSLTASATRSGPSVPLIIAGSATSGVALITGIALFAVASTKASDADAQLAKIKQAGTVCARDAAAGPCGDLRSINASADTLHNASIPLLVIGGTVAAATVAYALWPRAKQERAAAVRVIPALGPAGTGVWLTGAF